MNILIVSSKAWHRNYILEIEKQTSARVLYLEHPEDISYENIKRYNPQYIFFPHWSYIIPSEVYDNFKCIIFHMTDVPFGKGGSPLQNLIVRGIYQTKLSALSCEKELDSGAVYLKKDLSLDGGAEEILLRAAELTKEMIIEIIKNEILPRPQSGESVVFKRRTKDESNIDNVNDLKKVYDYIRMLDAEGYPKAFINTKYLHLEFERAALYDGYIKADVKIKIKVNSNE